MSTTSIAHHSAFNTTWDSSKVSRMRTHIGVGIWEDTLRNGSRGVKWEGAC